MDRVLSVIAYRRQFVACLKGATSGPTRLDDALFDERSCRASIAGADFGCGIVFHDIIKQILAFLFGDPEQALAHAAQAEKTLGAALAMPIEATYDAQRRSREAGFDLHPTKPIDHRILLRLLAGRPSAASAER